MAVDKVTTFKIYVGNLPDDTKDEDVQKIFEEYGNVVKCECVGKRAFVHMEDDIEGKFAVGELQGRELNGNTLTIQEARKNEPPKIPTVKLLVKNIKDTVNARGLRNLFKRFGCVIEVQIENGEGYVCLEAIGDIRSAMNEMNGYKIEDMELSVEPAPISAEEEADNTKTSESTTSSPQKKKNKGYGNWDSSWSRARQEYYASASNEYGYDDYGPSPYESPWINPTPSPFNPQPERILRDPYAKMRPFRGGPGSRGFRGVMGGPGGPRGMPPRMFPPVPPRFPGHPMGMPGPGRIMRSGMPRGMPPRGPRPHFVNDGYNEPQAYDQQIQRNNPFMPVDDGEQVFYEDEPISSISRSRQPPRMSLSGANTIPLGVPGAVPRVSWSNNVQRNGRARGGARRGGIGRGKFPKFTAVTDEVAPGERYPVPPPNNPGFRAPLKRPKEEVKRKVKKKKKPLVPAELPDYSLPVPDLSKPTVPKGAVLKPFPPPLGQSLIDSDTFGGSGSTNFFNQQEEQNNGSSQMDFTTDDLV